MAPLAPAIEDAQKSGKSVTTAIGARTASELLFVERMKKSSKVYTSTDDGSAGYNGFVPALASEILGKNKFEMMITCGPEIMIKKIFELGEKHKIPVQASIERYMKCGVGLCDACSIGGYLVCKDGPIFTYQQLKNTEFGKCSRDPSGRRIQFKWSK
jgi:dihydroorotate dehydrogenase electron transfer subunit